MELLKDKQDILDLIQEIAEEQGFKDHIITDVAKNQKGEGFLGQLYMVTIQDTVSKKEFHMVIKQAFADDKVRKMVPIRMSFENEVYFYSKVYPQFKKFGEERGALHIAHLVPNCIKTSLKDHNEIVAMENLKVSGFEVFDKKRFLDDEHVTWIFKHYGYFHAHSFALRDQRPEEYANLSKVCQNVHEEMAKHRDGYRQRLQNLSQAVEDFLVPGEDDEIISKYEKYRDGGIFAIFKQLVTENCDFSAILQGDCWSNNIMFKYEKNQNDTKIRDIRLIDWQMIKVGSPVCDLSYCLYSGASKSVLDNLDKYLKIYHESFSACVRKLGSDPDKLFPFTTLKEHWKKYSKFGMIVSLSIIKMKLTETENLVDFTDQYDEKEFGAALQNSKTDEKRYKKAIKDLLLHMIEVDVL